MNLRYLAVILMFLVILSGCIQSQSDGDIIKWLEYKDGMERVNETGKPAILYFYDPFMQLCKETKKHIFSNEDIIKMSKNFVMIGINVREEKNKNHLYNYRLQYTLYSYNNQYYLYLPTVIFLNNESEVLHRLIALDVYNPDDSKGSVESFLDSMSRALDGEIWGYNISFITLDGKTKSIEEYHGKVVLMDLMATWCTPCIRQMAELKKMLDYYGKDEIVVISIDVDRETDTPDKIKSTFDNYVNEWTFGIDKYGFSEKYWVMVIPTLGIFDKYGRLQYLKPGLVEAEELKNIIDEIR